MTEAVQTDAKRNYLNYVVYSVALAMALTGIINSFPSFWIIPRFGPFPNEVIRPAILAASVLIVILTNSFTSLFAEKYPTMRWVGMLIDTVILLTAWYTFWRYFRDVGEIEEGLFFFGPIHAVSAIAGSICFIVLCWRVWGSPLSICAIVALVYFYTGQYWPWILETAPVQLLEGTAGDLWFNFNDGVIGRIMGILIFTVFPFVLLGAMLEKTGGGLSLIKIAFT